MNTNNAARQGSVEGNSSDTMIDGGESITNEKVEVSKSVDTESSLTLTLVDSPPILCAIWRLGRSGFWLWKTGSAVSTRLQRGFLGWRTLP
jgi:hypothetical protein